VAVKWLALPSYWGGPGFNIGLRKVISNRFFVFSSVPQDKCGYSTFTYALTTSFHILSHLLFINHPVTRVFVAWTRYWRSIRVFPKLACPLDVLRAQSRISPVVGLLATSGPTCLLYLRPGYKYNASPTLGNRRIAAVPLEHRRCWRKHFRPLCRWDSREFSSAFGAVR
jgi:hypothetical protein